MTTVARRQGTTDERIALGWGFAEAVLFFVIPDVFLTLVAIRTGFRRAIRPALLATLGAILGGLAVYTWGAAAGSSAFAIMETLPAIDRGMIEAVRADVAAEGNAALLTGPLRGRPYKLYAAASGDLGLSLFGLALWTVPGRLGRFLITAAVAACLRAFFRPRLPERALLAMWGTFWVVVYAGYWLW